MVDIIGRAKVIVESAVDKSSLDTSGGTIGASLKKGALVGVAALGTLTVAGFKAFQAFEEAEAQSRKLNNVLGNMGKSGAAENVEKLADSLMRVTGIDDEVIKGGQTILATFSAVAKSAGETGGTFERATQASLDMSAVFGSVEGAARVLGKALSDPEKAAALLRRSNVVLTEEQKNLITAFTDSGNAAGAQDVILSALEDRYAGTAEAAKTESASIATAFGELKENVGAVVADLISALAGEGDEDRSLSGAIYDVSDAVDEFANSKSWKTLQGRISGTSELIGDMVGPISTLLGWWDKMETEMPILADALKVGFDPLTQLITLVDTAVEGWKELVKWSKKVRDALGKGGNIEVPDAPDISQPRSTRAVGGPASGWTLVGERGPELVSLPSGSYVHSSINSQGMLGGGGDSVVINNQYFGPVTGNEQKREIEWTMRYGLRFGSLTGASPAAVNA